MSVDSKSLATSEASIIDVKAMEEGDVEIIEEPAAPKSALEERILHCNLNVPDDKPAEKVPPVIELHDYDMIIVGAGISGINMAYRTQSMLKGKSYVILERRQNMGGTWDIMRYPGIRSDSDLYTFGFAWRPWNQGSPIAEGPLIAKYMKECAAETGIDKHIMYSHRVVEAQWQSREQAWTLEVEATSQDGTKTTKFFRGSFMVLGTGYYDYDTPLQTSIPGLENFKGKVVHPQFWPEDLKYKDKQVAVIGSGATAITLIPAMAAEIGEGKVTMVQRSPGYVVSLPNRVAPKAWWERILPLWLQHRITRLRFLLLGFIYRRFLSGDAEKTKIFLQRITQAQLPAHIPYDPHFKPNYAPWTQRMCLCPDGDFFKALHTKKADVATGIIQKVNEKGIQMEDGQTVDADIIVTATGLRMKYGGNANYYVDGEKIEWGEKFLWRGVMIQDMPNCAIVQGYTKASWTLGADATAHMVVRMVKHLDWHNFTSAVPRLSREQARITRATGVMGLTSNYILSALHRLPKTSDEAPWKGRGNYMKDIWDAKYSSINKGMQFTKRAYS